MVNRSLLDKDLWYRKAFSKDHYLSISYTRSWQYASILSEFSRHFASVSWKWRGQRSRKMSARFMSKVVNRPQCRFVPLHSDTAIYDLNSQTNVCTDFGAFGVEKRCRVGYREISSFAGEQRTSYTIRSHNKLYEIAINVLYNGRLISLPDNGAHRFYISLGWNN